MSYYIFILYISLQPSGNATVGPPVTRDITNATTDSSDLQLGRVDEDDAGLYECLAVLPHGISKVIKSYTITVGEFYLLIFLVGIVNHNYY